MSICSCEPMTGWYRDGYCKTDDQDHGHHVVCCVLTKEFLEFSKSEGNDLSTPMPQFGFAGLKPGDHWCLCCTRWKSAYEAGKAPKVNLNPTSEIKMRVTGLKPKKIEFTNTISM